MQSLLQIQAAERILEILLLAIKETKQLVNCQNCTVFVFNQEISASLVRVEKTQNFNLQKFTLADGTGRYVDALCENDKELSVPGFKKIDDVRYGIKK